MIDTRDLEDKLCLRAREKMEQAADEVRRQIEHDAPRDTGKLSTLIRSTTTDDGTAVVTKITTEARSGDDFDYGEVQDKGSGVFVGRGRIYPTRGKALKFFSSKLGRVVFAKSVAGVPPTGFFTKNVELWRDKLRDAYGR